MNSGPAQKNIPPTVMSWVILPLAAASLVSTVVHGAYYLSNNLDTLPAFWGSSFYVGTPIVVFLAAMLVTIRKRERTSYERVDVAALFFAAVSAIAYVGSFVFMWVRL